MTARAHLNCWIVAMMLWLSAHGKTYIWIRRSHSFLGMLPHFGHTERLGIRKFRTIEYRPIKNRLWSADDLGLIFSGHYVVTHYRIVAVRRWATKEQALADHYFPKNKKRNGHD